MSLATTVFLGLGLSARHAAALSVTAATGRRRVRATEVAYPIPATDGTTIDKDNQLILVRYQGALYAFALSCPHQNTALRWLNEDNRFQCSKHKSKYEPDGKFISGRATRHMDRLPIRTDGSQVYVDPDRVFESDKDAAGWAAAMVKV
ncbi:MAG: Rieske 2Fe-2S domain-containing protein [Gemmatimonadales bacterium]|nr:Rieske 2Fe-2S domain-containing protein [Gemmatimonadales bacterium]